MVAQADERTSDSDSEDRRFLGIPWWIWVDTLSGVVLATIIRLRCNEWRRAWWGGTRLSLVSKVPQE